MNNHTSYNGETFDTPVEGVTTQYDVDKGVLSITTPKWMSPTTVEGFFEYINRLSLDRSFLLWRVHKGDEVSELDPLVGVNDEK